MKKRRRGKEKKGKERKKKERREMKKNKKKRRKLPGFEWDSNSWRLDLNATCKI